MRSISDFRADSATYAFTASRVSATVNASTSSCSGAIARNVAPNTVSGRVVNTMIVSSLSSTENSISAPCDLPIQFFCIVLTISVQSRSSVASSISSAYAVIRKNHCLRFFFTTGLPQRQHLPPSTCSFASTVWSVSHHHCGLSF